MKLVFLRLYTVQMFNLMMVTELLDFYFVDQFNIWPSASRDRMSFLGTDAEISTLKSHDSHFVCPQLPCDKCKAWRTQQNIHCWLSVSWMYKMTCFESLKQDIVSSSAVMQMAFYGSVFPSIPKLSLWWCWTSHLAAIYLVNMWVIKFIHFRKITSRHTPHHHVKAYGCLCCWVSVII